ncbi:hypothetical protein BCV69DRAFT_281688 [Microstroma glucosiphilum]|uniref:Uncharacterized protein n=1 Tax=Pseudomicrostroma glucosiphilum TaxID=1684307 RepID=A0A316U957_9BASI|nr:hypothetical protein BCV69DRAFT_281688 [Pseudomicrostroma glucosiphilum]PWN21760.1 hypothetical protein BCV69DRAFT_281688 [Pseudomicrostroma glucosiphilum]
MFRPSAQASLARSTITSRPRIANTANPLRAHNPLRSTLLPGTATAPASPSVSTSSPRLALPFHTSTARFALLRPSAPLYAANPQSGKPASDNWKHTAQNIKEEVGQVKDSLESAVAGGDSSSRKGSNDKSTEGQDPGMAQILGDAKSITSEMAQVVPQPALLWGAAGVMPYVGTAGASIYLSRQANLVANGLDSHMDLETATALLLHAQNIQVAYGAIILSFLGAIHWGFEWAKLGGRVGNLRYAMGVAPLALAWPSLLLAPQMALIAQWAAYVAVWFIDLRATTEGWAPRWYSTYRFWLTAAVGTSIIATLAGTQYYDVSPSRSSARSAGSKLASEIRDNAAQKAQEARSTAEGNQGTQPLKGDLKGGDVFAEQSSGEEEGFVKIRNPKRVEEERKKKEEEEKKKKKEEEEKKKKEEEEEKKKKQEEEEKSKKEGGEEKKEGEGEGEGEEGGQEKKEGEGEGEGEGGEEKKEGGDEKKDK